MVELLAELELAVRLVVVLVHVLQEVRSQGRWEWMRKIGVDHNTQPLCTPSPLVFAWATSTPWSPGSQHPLTQPRILNLPLKVLSPTLLRLAFVHPPPLVFAWVTLTPSLL